MATATGFAAMAQRESTAFARLVETIAEIGAIPSTDAERVARVYLSRAIRAVRLDVVGGNFLVKHGAFMDRAVIRRALASTEG